MGGCKDAFNGDGICFDVENDDLSTIDLTVDKKLGLCKNNLKKDCCYCYKKKSKTDCSGKCTYKERTGVCVAPNDVPPPNHMKTDGKCPGKHCGCWVPISDKCSSDPVCEQSLHGECVPEGSDLADHRPSTYKCKDDDNKNCTCWTPHCFHQDCSAKAYTYKPGDFCERELDCKCYRPKCAENKTCAKLGGQCFMSGMKIPAGAEQIVNKGRPVLCNKKLKCKCMRLPKEKNN